VPITAEQLKTQSRRLDRLNAKAAQVLAFMREGHALHSAFVDGKPAWRVNGRYVDPQVASLITNNPHVVGVGDALPIIGGPSQTWRYAKDD